MVLERVSTARPGPRPRSTIPTSARSTTSARSSGIHYLTMAYIEGQPLSALIEPGKPLDLQGGRPGRRASWRWPWRRPTAGA